MTNADWSLPHRINGNLFMPVRRDGGLVTLYSALMGVRVEIDGRALGMLATLLTSCQCERIRAQCPDKDDENANGFVYDIRVSRITNGDDLEALMKVFADK